MPTDANRRRNQIVATRLIEKMRRERRVSDLSSDELWHWVEECIADSVHTRKYLGQTDKAATAVMAELAVGELKLRGVQLQLPI